MPCAPQVSDTHTPSHPCDVKENVIHQNRPPSSIAPWSSSNCHVPIVGSGQGSAWAPCLVGGYAAPHARNCDAMCFLTPFFRTGIDIFNNLSNRSSSVGSDHMGRPSLSTCIIESWSPMTLSPVHHCFLLETLLIDTDHCRPAVLEML